MPPTFARRAAHREAAAALDLNSLRHTFASLARTADESAFNVSRFLGRSRSVLVDQVHAHSIQSGMAHISENMTARAVGIKPQLRVIEGGKSPEVRQPLENPVADQAWFIYWLPGLESHSPETERDFWPQFLCRWGCFPKSYPRRIGARLVSPGLWARVASSERVDPENLHNRLQRTVAPGAEEGAKRRA